MKFSVEDMIKIILIAAVGIWLLKLLFAKINIPVIGPAIEGL